MTETPVWTPDRVATRLREGVAALRASPGGAIGPASKMAFWPAVPADFWISYGQEEVRMPRLRATGAQIDRMDAMLGWFGQIMSREMCRSSKLPEDTGVVLWFRAAGWSWARISQLRRAEWAARGGGRPPGGNSQPSLAVIEDRGLSYLARCLNRAGVPVDAETEARSAPDRTPSNAQGSAQ